VLEPKFQSFHDQLSNVTAIYKSNFQLILDTFKAQKGIAFDFYKEISKSYDESLSELKNEIEKTIQPVALALRLNQSTVNNIIKGGTSIMYPAYCLQSMYPRLLDHLNDSFETLARSRNQILMDYKMGC
jgi:hypothetical protein